MSSQAGGLLTGGSGGVLDGVTNTGTTTLGPSAYTTLQNSLNNTGTVTFANSTTSTQYLAIAGAVTLSGAGEVVLVNANSNIYDPGGGSITNTGNVIHGGNGGIINVPVTNQATIRADNGVLNVNAPITNTGGTVAINNGATLALNSTITGGTLSSQAGGLLLNGTLSGVTNTGTTTIGPSSYTILQNSLNNTGTVTFANSTSSTQYLAITGAVTLSGAGEVVLVNANSNIYDTGGASLTNSSNLIHGGNGGSIGVPVTNSGNIFADNGTLNLTRTLTQTGAGTVSVALDGSNFATSGLLSGASIIIRISSPAECDSGW